MLQIYNFMPNLNTDIKFLTGVGEKRADLLNAELDIYTIEDLLYYFPFKYIDKTKFYKIDELTAELPYVQVIGKLVGMKTEGAKYKQRLTATFADETGYIELLWFKGVKWIKSSLKADTEYVLYGKPSIYSNKINIVHPDLEKLDDYKSKINSSLEPAYNTSEKLKTSFLNTNVLRKLLQTALKQTYNDIAEPLPFEIIKKYNLISLKDALVNIHFPKNNTILSKAEYRLKFEELFFIQLNIIQKKLYRNNKQNGYVFSKVGDYFNGFYKNNLPFELTGAQKKVLKEIRKDLGSKTQMNRLLQGDVGSGKTLVALMSVLIALDNGFQACLMAPTEILANQHLETVQDFLKGLDINIALLTGSTKKKDRIKLHNELESGDIHLLIGTHALIEDVVKFKNLGLVIIDEQHRFGVAQRAKLWNKNINPPHVLVMTATPIPRTLAMTLYGDLEVSVIDELPPGRKPIKTLHFFDNKRHKLIEFIRKQIVEGRQIYIVYPLIKESEKLDYKDLEDGYDTITREFPLPKYKVSIVHGKMKAANKEIEMQNFAKGRTNIMVATTVIEVGVNVPNASVMIIESSERFGLSQLHQLRGRVGRGAEQSYCVLMSGYKLSQEAKKRLGTMVKTNDGFEISEVDLKLRGPGDIDGTQQSGIPINLKIANLAKDNQIVLLAREAAQSVLDYDIKLEKPENRPMVNKLKSIFDLKKKWSKIS